MEKLQEYLRKFNKPSWSYEQYEAISSINKLVSKAGKYAKKLVFAPILIKSLLNYIQNYDFDDQNDHGQWENEKIRTVVMDVLEKLGDLAVEPLLKLLNERNIRLIMEVLGKVGDKRAVLPLIGCLKDADTYLQEEIISILGEMGDDRAAEALIEHLNAKENRVQTAAAEALGKLGGRRAVEALIECLTNNLNINSLSAASYPTLEETIILALSEIGDSKALKPLIKCLTHKNKWVRQAAARALGKFKTANAVEHLLHCLSDPTPEVRRMAILSLGKINDVKVVEPLCEYLKSADSSTAGYIFQVLGRLGDKRAVGPLIEQIKFKERDLSDIIEALGRLKDKKSVESILLCLKADSPWWLKRTITITLGELGDIRAGEQLITMLKEDEKTRPWAIEAIYKLSPPPIELLIDCLKNPVPEVRENAAWALGQIGDKKAIKPLMDCLLDSNPYIIMRAAESLSKLGAHEGINRLIALLRIDDDNWAYKFSRVLLGFSPDDLKDVPRTEDTIAMVIKALGELGDRDLVHDLVVNLWVESKIVRFMVAEALNKLNDSTVVELIIEQLDDSDSWIRMVAAEALGILGDKSTVEPLIQLLNDRDEQVQRKVAIALGHLRDPKAIDPLIACFQVYSYSTWRDITWVLGELGSDAIDPLINCLNDKNTLVRGLALEALGRIGNSRAVEFLIPYLEDKNEDVQEKALEAISKIPFNKKEEDFLIFNKIIEHLEHDEIDRIWTCLRNINQIIDSSVGKLNYDTNDSLEALTRYFWEAHEIIREKILELFIKLVGRAEFYFIELFEKCLEDKNFAIRRLAAEGIRRIDKMGDPFEI